MIVKNSRMPDTVVFGTFKAAEKVPEVQEYKKYWLFFTPCGIIRI